MLRRLLHRVSSKGLFCLFLAGFILCLAGFILCLAGFILFLAGFIFTGFI